MSEGTLQKLKEKSAYARIFGRNGFDSIKPDELSELNLSAVRFGQSKKGELESNLDTLSKLRGLEYSSEGYVYMLGPVCR